MSSWEPPSGNQPPPGGEDPFGQPPQYGQPQTPPPGQYGQPPAYNPPPGNAPYGQPQYGQPPINQPQYGAPGYGGYPAAPPPSAYGAPMGGALLPGATRPLNIGNRVVAFVIDWVIFAILDVIAISSGSSAFRLIVDLITIAVAIYFVYLTGSGGQTPGKKIMGVKVVDASSGQAIGFWRALGRIVVQGICNIVCFAGLWSAFLDSKSGRYQGWHDKALSTQVISVK